MSRYHNIEEAREKIDLERGFALIEKNTDLADALEHARDAIDDALLISKRTDPGDEQPETADQLNEQRA